MTRAALLAACLALTFPVFAQSVTGFTEADETMQLDVDNDTGKEWYLLEANIDCMPHFVGVMPHVPPSALRATFPVRVTVTISYEANENGLPTFADDLAALNGLEEDFRSWDPDEVVFRNAIRSTGGGERRWVLYATSAEEFKALVPENDLIAITTTTDPDWSAVLDVLAGIRR